MWFEYFRDDHTSLASADDHSFRTYAGLLRDALGESR